MNATWSEATTADIPAGLSSLPVHQGPCVYFLLMDDQVVYVGSTKRLFARLSHHAEGTHCCIKKRFNSARFMPVSAKALTATERQWIERLQPKYNSPMRLDPDEALDSRPPPLVLMVDDELRHALRLEAAKRDVDMSDIVSELLAENLVESLAEARQRRGEAEKGSGKPGRKSKRASEEGGAE